MQFSDIHVAMGRASSVQSVTIGPDMSEPFLRDVAHNAPEVSFIISHFIWQIEEKTRLGKTFSVMVREYVPLYYDPDLKEPFVIQEKCCVECSH